MFLSKVIACSNTADFQKSFNAFMNSPDVIPLDYQYNTSNKKYEVKHFLIPPSQWGIYSKTVHSALIHYRWATVEEMCERVKDMILTQFKAEKVEQFEYSSSYNAYWWKAEELDQYNLDRVQYILRHDLKLNLRNIFKLNNWYDRGSLEYLIYRNPNAKEITK